MKILWVANVIIPRIERMQGKPSQSVFGGWLSGLSDELLGNDMVELCFCYPQNESINVIKGNEKNFSFFGFPQRVNNTGDYFVELLNAYNPDIIHFFGTEFTWSYQFALKSEELGYLNRTVASIQGMVSVYTEHFFADIPLGWRYTATLSEICYKNSMRSMYRSYQKRGYSEIKEVKLIPNIIGRTNWDKGCTKLINPHSEYYKCNETLRNAFYSGSWSLDNCEKRSIYFSQGSKPIKGLHILLKALEIVLKHYPDTQVYVAGDNILRGNWIKGSAYGLYLKSVIRKHGLKDHIHFLGKIDAEKVKERLLKTHVFVSASSIENSSNSLGEAMLLGVPCIASDVGGTSNMIQHNKEGYVYPFNEFYMLAFYIMEIFSDSVLSNQFSKNARCRAMITHDPKANNDRLMEIYKDIMEKNQDA